MKSRAAGLKARFFSVMMLVVPLAIASSAGKTLSWGSLAPKWSADSCTTVRNRPVASRVSRIRPGAAVAVTDGPSHPCRGGNARVAFP
jgi:hypothetical protein